MKIRKKALKTVKYLAVAVFWLGLWQFIALRIGSELILPSPKITLLAFMQLASQSDFYMTALFSVERIMLGFAVGITLGTALGFSCAFVKPLDYLFSPMRSIIKATPVSSFILLLLFWTDKENVASYISMLIVLPIVYSSVYEGIKSTDKLLVEMADFYKVPKIKQIFTVYTESVKSRFIAASTTSLGLAWKAGIAAEVLANPDISIGGMLYKSKIYLETPQLFAWTALVILLSVAIEKIILLILRLIKKEEQR